MTPSPMRRVIPVGYQVCLLHLVGQTPLLMSSAEADRAFDPEDLDLHDVEMFVERSMKYGLGDYRPDFGSFTATLNHLRTQRGDANANGSKARDKTAERVAEAAAARVMVEA